jgi:hypothetical protein
MPSVSTYTSNPFNVNTGPGIAWSDLDYKNRNDVISINSQTGPRNYRQEQEDLFLKYKESQAALDKFALNIINEINSKKQTIVDLTTNRFNFTGTFLDYPTASPLCTPAGSAPDTDVTAGIGETFLYNPVPAGIGSVNYSVGYRSPVYKDQIGVFRYPLVDSQSTDENNYRKDEGYDKLTLAKAGFGVTAYLFYDGNDKGTGISTSELLGYYYHFTSCSAIDSDISSNISSITSMRSIVDDFLTSNGDGSNNFRALKSVEEVNFWFENKGFRSQTIYDYQGAQAILEQRQQEIKDNL